MSGAIDKKLRYAVRQLHNLLSSRYGELTAPLEEARQEKSRLTRGERSVSDQLKKELRLLNIEADALFNHLTERGAGLKEEQNERIREHLEMLLEGGPCDRKYADVIIDSIERYARESLSGGCAELATGVERPILKAASVHAREFERLQTALTTSIENTVSESKGNEYAAGRLSELREIQICLPPLAEQIEFPENRSGLFKLLERPAARRERLRDTMAPPISHWVSESIRGYLDTLREKTHTAMSTLKEEVRAPYTGALEEIRKRMAEIDHTLSEMSKTIGPEARKYSQLLESFEEIKSDIERLGR